MDFQDFPMILGNLGVETDHPPKMCAGLVPWTWRTAVPVHSGGERAGGLRPGAAGRHASLGLHTS